ncbi:MAG TPA: hypothetical protein VLC28_05535, partial [Flavitalea sp.]|nr:hypothetical protein [Flavitalea sp.]
MKRFIALAIAAGSFAACADNAGDTTKTESRDTSTTVTATPLDTTMTTTTTATTTYTPADGDVTYRDNKVMVMRNGAWEEAD